MKITTELLEDRQVRLVIEIDAEQTEKAMKRAARQISKQVNIPGFRKGKAPYDVILRHYGEDTVRQEAAESLVEESFAKALEEEDIKPFASPELEQVELDPITFTFTVPLIPTIDLGDYREYRLKHKKVKVAKKEVKRALENIRRQNALLELVERPVEMGDGVSVELVGEVDGEVVLSGDDVHLMVESDSAYPAPGFAKEVVGMEAGDERTFTLVLPDDFPREELRGQEAAFTVKVVEVYDQTLPDLDDDLARTIGNYDSLKELEAQVKEQLQEEAQRAIDEEYTTQVLEDILEQTQIAYPPMMLEETLDDMVEEYGQRVKRETRLSLADYLRMNGSTEEEVREELIPDAERQLRRSLMLSKVIDQEGLEVSGEEIDAEIEALSMPWGVRADEMRKTLSSEQGRGAVHNRLLSDKGIDRLVAIAKGEEPEKGPDVEASEEE